MATPGKEGLPTRAISVKERLTALARSYNRPLSATACRDLALQLLTVDKGKLVPSHPTFQKLIRREDEVPDANSLVKFELMLDAIDAIIGNDPRMHRYAAIESVLERDRPAIDRALYSYFARAIKAQPQTWGGLGFHLKEPAGLGATLLCDKNWIPSDRLRYLKDVSLTWLPDRHVTAFTSGTVDDISSRLINLARKHGSPEPWNDITYRVMGVTASQNGKVQFRFCIGNYFDYLNSCEKLAREAAESYGNNGDNETEIAIGQKICDPTTSRSATGRGRRPRTKEDFLDYESRSVAAGINTLLVFAPRSRSARPFFYLHRRDNTVEAKKLTHVIPSGTFQPYIALDEDHLNEFNLEANVLREFCEEILGKQEIMKRLRRGADNPQLKNWDDLYDAPASPELARTRKHFRSGAVRQYYLGAGFDLVTCKLEILTLLLVSQKRMWDVLSDIPDLHNEEGRIDNSRQWDFSEDCLTEALRIDNLLPAGAGCLVQALRHFGVIRENLNQMR